MGLEQVVDEIRAQGRREAEAIEQEAEAEANELLEEARQEAQREADKVEREAEATAADRARRIKASAQLDAKMKRLGAEADVLASVRARVEDRLRDLPQDERATLIEALVEQADAHEMGKGAKAWGRGEDQDLIESLGFSFQEPIDCLGGVIVENSEGSVREDLRFETVLDRVWRASAHDIVTEILEG